MQGLPPAARPKKKTSSPSASSAQLEPEVLHSRPKSLWHVCPAVWDSPSSPPPPLASPPAFLPNLRSSPPRQPSSPAFLTSLPSPAFLPHSLPRQPLPRQPSSQPSFLATSPAVASLAPPDLCRRQILAAASFWSPPVAFLAWPWLLLFWRCKLRRMMQ